MLTAAPDTLTVGITKPIRAPAADAGYWRATTVQPLFGQTEHARAIRRLRRRGLPAVQADRGHQQPAQALPSQPAARLSTHTPNPP